MKRDSRQPEVGSARKSAAEKEPAPSASGNAATGKIRQRNVQKILRAAEIVFAKSSFEGASTADIARRAGVPKANLHYYFRTKQDLYSAVLVEIVESWLDALEDLEVDNDPAEALGRYIARKMQAAQASPVPSRLWAIEIIGGARHVQPFLKGRLRKLVEEKSVVIETWIAEGRIVSVEPAHLFFMIWAMTQTYADFAAQIEAVLGKKSLDGATFRDAAETATRIILGGLGLMPSAMALSPAPKAVTRTRSIAKKSGSRA